MKFSPEDARKGVLVGHAKHDDGAAIVAVKVNALRHLAASDREEDRPPPAVARSPIVIQCKCCLHHIRRLNEDQLQSHQLLQIGCGVC